MADRKKWTTWRILGIVGVVVIFGARMYRTYLSEDEDKKRKKVLDDLSRQQAEEQSKRDAEMFKAYTDSTNADRGRELDESKKKLNSLKINLEKSRAKFDSSMKALETKQ